MEEPEVLTTCNSGRRIHIDPNYSPEFEFWMIRNPSFPQPDLLSADELFSDGILLPLHNLQCPIFYDPPDPNPPSDKTDSVPETEISACESTLSKRWKDIFKKNNRNIPSIISQVRSEERRVYADLSLTLEGREIVSDSQEKKKKEKKCGAVAATTTYTVKFHKARSEKDRMYADLDLTTILKGGESISEKKKEKKCGAAGRSNINRAELNINIWPFSRSRSAGNSGIRSRMVRRKGNSAPCSRSNSAGESKSTKWPSSPSRTNGVYLGRKTRVMKLNVPVCIGYRQQSVCRSDENSAISGQSGGEGVRSSNLLNIRSIFTKKVH
ncbi:uncharacterized protein LOC132607966 [Lycium barbarum]|uniref:uncharacterized protein LOC132607966 n=1 Tax=Lycium barbarum TaxID=112863 RepID=UPI00293F20C6|nr:uncharacterized protein LOC132607966 [Lycium barbarum]